MIDLFEPESASTRDGFGKALVRLGNNKSVVVLSADLSESTRANWFKDKYPHRYIELGVAEQNMAGVAAGLSLEGKIPFICSFAAFSPARNWDQIRVSICYSEANVKIFGGHAGLNVGEDGATHQALEDIAIMRALPNMKVVVPCDAVEMEKATIAAAEIKGPVYLRSGRDKFPIITTKRSPFKIGRANILRKGKDVTIIACGLMAYEALVAAELLKEKGISAMVVNNHTIKPIDRKTIIDCARKTKAVVTAEEHQVSGGLGSAVSEVLGSYPVPVKMVAVMDRFGQSGKTRELLEKYGITHKDIVKAVVDVLRIKRKF